MKAPTSRRGVLAASLALVGSTALAAVPAIARAQAKRCRVAILGEERVAVQQRAFDLSDAADAIEATWAANDRCGPRVQVGNRRNSAGVREPLYVHTREEVEDYAAGVSLFHPHLRGQWLATFEDEERRIAVVSAQSGHAAIRAEVKRLLDRRDEIEREMARTVATSPAGLIAQLDLLEERLDYIDGTPEELIGTLIAGVRNICGEGA